MTVAVSAEGFTDIDTGGIADFAVGTLDREGVARDAALMIALVTADEIAALNEAYMGKSGPTDVLSFPIEDAQPGNPPVREPDGPPLSLGDIFISPAVVSEHADEYGVSFEDELFLMVCHGVLHILGWDHQTDTEAEAMERRESEHLATIGRVRR